MDWKTQNSRREDLEAIEVNFPEGYIGPKILPPVVFAEKSGDITVQEVVTDVAGQSGLADGSTPTRTAIAMGAIAFTCVRKNKGFTVAKGEVKQYRTIENADRVGGIASKRSVMRLFEDDVAGVVFGATPWAARITATTGKLFDSINQAAQNVKRVKGDLALVLSNSLFTRFISLAEVTSRMSTGSFAQLLQMSASSQLSRDPQFLAAMLQTFYSFNLILVGDDDHWQLAGKESACAIVKLPPADEFAHKMDPVLGKTFVYWPDESANSGIPCEIESWADDDTKRNVYDAEAYWDTSLFNASGIQIVDLSADIATTTTT